MRAKRPRSVSTVDEHRGSRTSVEGSGAVFDEVTVPRKRSRWRAVVLMEDPSVSIDEVTLASDEEPENELLGTAARTARRVGARGLLRDAIVPGVVHLVRPGRPNLEHHQRSGLRGWREACRRSFASSSASIQPLFRGRQLCEGVVVMPTSLLSTRRENVIAFLERVGPPYLPPTHGSELWAFIERVAWPDPSPEFEGLRERVTAGRELLRGQTLATEVAFTRPGSTSIPTARSATSSPNSPC
jgi:hypothetical protein